MTMVKDRYTHWEILYVPGDNFNRRQITVYDHTFYAENWKHCSESLARKLMGNRCFSIRKITNEDQQRGTSFTGT